MTYAQNAWHENCGSHCVKTCELQIADWARAEQRKKTRAERRVTFFGNVRVVFILLFFAAVFLFVHNHQVQVETIASKGFNRAMEKPAALSDKLRENALNHEKEVDQINQPSGNQP